MERLRALFFRSFLSLLLVVIAAAEWASLAWVLHAFGLRSPLVLHVLAPFGIYALNGWVVGRRVRGRRGRPVVDRLIRLYAAIAFTCIFCALFLAFAALVAAIGTIVLPAEAEAALFRPWLWFTNLGMATIAAAFLYGYTVGRRQLTVTQLEVPVPGLPPALAGLRIVQLSDLHIGAYLGREELAEHVHRVNALAPDLICITGDLVDRPETCQLAFPTLAGLRARYGVLVILGNHDVYAGADTVTEALRRLTPFTVLRNARTEVHINGTALPVLGLDDLGLDWARGVPEHPALADLAATVPAGQPFLVLSHRPDCFPQAARLGASLVLSGHTHGGQLALPGFSGRRNLAQFITAFDRGVYRAGEAMLYVNRGLGFTGQPVRLFTAREIACLELRPSRATAG